MLWDSGACCCSCDPVVIRIEHSVQDIDTVGIERCIDTDIRTSGTGVLMRVIELRLLIEASVVHIDGVALYVEGGAVRDRLQVDVEDGLIDACCRCVGAECVQDAISRAERASRVEVDLVASCDCDSLQPLNDGCVVIGVSLVRSERTTGAGDAFFAGTVIGLTYGKLMKKINQLMKKNKKLMIKKKKLKI